MSSINGLSRRSIRSFEERAVEAELIEKLRAFAAGMEYVGSYVFEDI